MRSVALEHLANHPQLRMLPVQRAREITNEDARHVLDRVLANAVDAGHAHPPQRILYLVARDLGLILVHVRKIVAEPAVEGVANVDLIRVGREQRGVAKLVELVLCKGAVEPVWEWRILDPWVLRADVIRHLILKDL